MEINNTNAPMGIVINNLSGVSMKYVIKKQQTVLNKTGGIMCVMTLAIYS